jgi:hypothetical protein
MVQNNFDVRIKIQEIVDNQLPEFLISENPKSVDFLKQYYISQEYPGGPVDIVDNLDNYLKLDNLIPEVISGNTTLTQDITSTDDIISVESTKGFPEKYGLIKIDSEIITYTGITTNTFTGCIRGFSGITEYNGINTPNELTFSTSESDSHKEDVTVINLSSLFLKEFYNKIKYLLTPGLENIDFYSDINVSNFIKEARSFYQSKGTEESFRILFKLLYGEDVKVIDLEKYLIKPSSAEFLRREVIVAEKISGDPTKLIGQTITKTKDPTSNASVSEVEIIRRRDKSYYKLSLFVGYDSQSLIQGSFNVQAKTRVTEKTEIGSSIISVDSTIGFSESGILISGENVIEYNGKTINQFINCSGITEEINPADDIRNDDTIFSYENGDLSKKVELRITGVLSDLEETTAVYGVTENEYFRVKNIGEIIPNRNENRKQVIANSWIYNTSSRYQVESVSGSTFTLKSLIDKSSLKIGDEVEILIRGTQDIVSSQINIVTVSSVSTNTVTLFGLLDLDGQPFDPLDTGKIYYNASFDLRRKLKKASSSLIPIQFGNNKVLSNIQNVYNDSDEYLYVASNGLPSYEITKDVIEAVVANGSEEYLTDYISEDGVYSTLIILSNPFRTGDAVVYKSESVDIGGLVSDQVYYVEVTSNDRVKLYTSISLIGSDDYVGFQAISENDGSHTFTLLPQAEKLLGIQSILRKFPINTNLASEEKYPTLGLRSLGLLVNGVELLNTRNGDKIYYGPLKSVSVLNGGENYDVINPPKIEVSNPSIGTTALIQPVISGSVKEVLIDPQDFDLERVLSVTITGGNGKGCTLFPELKRRFREVEFDGRRITEGGGVDIFNETITFLSEHRFLDGEKIIYNSDGNDVGIGIYNGPNISQDRTLVDGAIYYAKLINSRTIQLYESLDTFSAGINTVGFTTVNLLGIHRFRTIEKNTLSTIDVLTPGSGYTNRKLLVKPSGISTTEYSVTFENHNFNDGDLIEYYSTGTPIVGLTTTNQYYVIKVDNNSFRLANAGIETEDATDYNRKKYVRLSSTGSGFHVFKYPDISVNINVSFGSSITGIITATPIIRGEVVDAYLYEEGIGYGSTTINLEKKPIIRIKNGKNAALRPVILNGKIVRVEIESSGSEYFSLPDLVVDGDGTGAKLRAVITNEKISRVIVLNSGKNYTTEKTKINIRVAGSGAILNPMLRDLNIDNNVKYGNELLITSKNNLEYGLIGYDTTLGSSEFNDTGVSHSPIIGWAYDGNPVYGPYGYSDPEDQTSALKTLVPGYTLNPSNISDRPSGFPSGFFIEDYSFNNSGDLDEYNGRWCKTPEFPNGTYAYFATIDSLSGNSIFPYFIGNYFRSQFLSENITLDQSFNINESNFIRNTFPYGINNPYTDNDFIIESNEISNQKVSVESVSAGSVENYSIIESGYDYKVGDDVVVDNTDTEGGGLIAYVSSVTGKEIQSIETNIDTYNNFVFIWDNSSEVSGYISTYHSLLENDNVSISGISTFIPRLQNNHKIQVESKVVTLFDNIPSGTGQVIDIYVSQIPNLVKVDGLIGIGSEGVNVLNIFPTNNVLRVKRSLVGSAHSISTEVKIITNKFKIPLKTDYFDSKLNDKIYFNPQYSVGVGTTAGVGNDALINIGDLYTSVSIPTQSIYLPNHPFKTGQRVILTKPNLASPILVSNTSTSSPFNLPISGDTQEVYIVNKSKNFIGIVTAVGLTTNTSGLFFNNNGDNNYEYSIESDFSQVTGKVQKIKSLVSITTSHNLENNDQISLAVNPNLSVGVGTSSAVKVLYNNSIDRLLVNPIGFTSYAISTTADSINISNHGFKTGDKVYYSSTNTIASGLDTGFYYIYKIDEHLISLTETYLDSISSTNPPIVSIASTGGSGQSLSLVNPEIVVSKNSNIVFDLSDSSLSGYNFKFFYDKSFNKEFISSTDDSNFNIVGTGTIGITSTASITLNYSDNVPELFYTIENEGNVLMADSDVKYFSRVSYNDSKYNGNYVISGVGTTTFEISLRSVPEKLTYTSEECDVLEYSTTSKNATGGVSKLKLVSGGYGYKKLPTFSSIISENGLESQIKFSSQSIGKVNKIRILDQGFEYSIDKTLKPQTYIPPILNIKNSDKITSIEVLDGGKNYITSPEIVIVDPDTREVIDSGFLRANLTSSSINSIEIVSTPYGLRSVQHLIFTTGNSNGIGILSATSSPSGIVTCTLLTPISGFPFNPFNEGDTVFVEGIQKLGTTGTGLNSKDYGYEFFPVISYLNTNPAIIEFDLSGLTSNPGIAVTFSSTVAKIINYNDYPKFNTSQERSLLLVGENILVKSGSSFLKVDLKIISSNLQTIKVDGRYDQVVPGTIIKGETSGIIAEIDSIITNTGIFKIDYSTKQNYSWISDTGKLNNTFQVSPNNDYYQNLSYSVRSTKQFNELSGPVNQLLHPVGLKNFSDTQVSSAVTAFVAQGVTTESIVLDISSENRVDTINYFDLSLDTNVVGNTSRFIRLKNKKLTNYINCISNIALKIDDISPQFSNLENRKVDASFTKDIIDYNDTYANFLVEIKEPNTNNIQFTELVTLNDGENIFTLEKSNLYNTPGPLGEILGIIDEAGEQSLNLIPTNPFNPDLDVKILKNNFSSVDAGIGTYTLGFIKLNGSISTTGIGATSTVISINTNNEKAFYASVQIINVSNNESNFVDLYVTHDETDSYISEYYFDSTEELFSNNFIGSFTSSINSGVLSLNYTNNSDSDLLIRSRIVGFGSTSLGISTYRFKKSDQPDGTEKTVRLQSNYTVSTGSTSILSVNLSEISSIKSLVRVSVGDTSAMHQLMLIHNQSEIVIKQYPILSIGSTSGIGTFGGEYDGFNLKLNFYPDANVSGDISLQSYSQLFYTDYDLFNEPESLEYSKIRETFSLSFFDSIDGNRYDKKSFEARFNGTPIFEKTFNPQNSLILNPSTGVFTIKNHFFNTGERLIYTPASTFNGIPGVSVSIGATLNSVGLVTTILPSEVYAIRINSDQFQISTRYDYATTGSGIAVTFTDLGSGNAHKLSMSKKVEKTVLSIDGVVQSPLKYTPISHNLVYNGGSISGVASVFSISGISTISPEDVLKIDDEFMRVISVGIGTLSSGPITGIGTYYLTKVERGVVGSAATTHLDSTQLRVYRGAYNISDNKIHFIVAPKGVSISDEDPGGLPRASSSFNGRVYLRQDYSTNVLYDDISDQFTGIGQTMTLTIQGINTTGIETGNSLVFVNDIFQIPTTDNNIGNNYDFRETGGQTKIVFTGITSLGGSIITSEFDINQNQLPRNGIIVSLGSTQGLGFAPLAGAAFTSWSSRFVVGAGGSIVSVAIGKSDNFGSGYFGRVSFGATESGHVGSAATIIANVGAGGTITGFVVSYGGTGYTNPQLMVPEPSYSNLPVIGVSRSGVGSTTATGVGLLMNLEVSPAPIATGIGSTLFEVSSFKITRSGYNFKTGDVFKPVGLVTAKGLPSPINDFTLTVLDVFTDSFSALQFGELDYIDTIESLQNGVRTRFPLIYKGELLTFETDDPILDLNSVLLIFIDGVVQDPGVSYQFTGGSSFTFTEAPKPENNISIFFYRGTRGVDSQIVDVVETIKVGDTVQIFKNNYISNSITQNQRIVVGINTSDEFETNIYSGVGIEDNPQKYKPLSWTKQKVDKIIGGDYLYKSRDSIESLIYPTAKVIKNFLSTDTQIYVDDAKFFNYEENESPIEIIDFDAIVIPQSSPVSAAVTAIVSAAGTIGSMSIVNAGSGYTGYSIDLKIAAPRSISLKDGSGITIGISTIATATATATITNGAITAPIIITNPGIGYSQESPPDVIVPLPEFKTENVNTITNVQGFSGIITGIGTTTGTGSNPLAFKFNLRTLTSLTFSGLEVGDPIYIFDTKVGRGVTTIDTDNNDVVGIGTTFLNNIYYVHSISSAAANAEIICNVKSNTYITGITSSGSSTKPLGKFSWGKLTVTQRPNPISIAVTGFTVDAGLSTFPTIQRRGFGFKNSGSVRENIPL